VNFTFAFTRRLTIVTEVSRDFIELLQAFHRLGLTIIFYRSVINCYVDSILQPFYFRGRRFRFRILVRSWSAP